MYSELIIKGRHSSNISGALQKIVASQQVISVMTMQALRVAESYEAIQHRLSMLDLARTQKRSRERM
jgi:hypothetical protein